MYLGFLAITGLGLSAVVTSHRITSQLLLASKVALNDRVQETQLNLSRLAAVIQSEKVAIMSTYVDGRVTSWNPGAQHLYSYTAKQMIGRSVLTLVPPEAMESAKSLLASVKQGHPTKISDAVRLHQNGDKVQIWLSAAPVHDAHGNLVGISRLSRSTKASLEAQAAKHQQRAVEQKLASLQAIADFKTQFLNMASHELRTPRTPLKLQLRMLSLGVEGQPKLQQGMQSLERNLSRLTGLVDD